MMLVPLVAALALALPVPSTDSLRLLARRVPQSVLIAEARATPVMAREAVSASLHDDDIESARRLAAAFAIAWQDSFLLREVDRFASWPPERRAARLWADSLRRAGISAYASEGAEAAVAIWQRALARTQAAHDSALTGALTGNIGAGFLSEGMLDSAGAYLGRAQSIARAIGDRSVEANVLVSLAVLSEDLGEPATARTQYGRAMALQERIGDSRGVAATRNGLGLLAWTMGDLAEARRQLELALDLNRRERRDEVAATNVVNLAGLATLEGDFARAQRLYADALSIWRARGAWADAADALHGLGGLELRRGDYSAARDALREALAIYERTGQVTSALAVRQALAGAHAARGEMQEAIDILRIAEDVADTTDAGAGQRAGIALAHADLAVQLNDLAQAEQLYTAAQRFYREADDPDGEGEALHGLALLLIERDEHARARTLLESVLRTREARGDVRASGLTLLALGQVARATGDTALALRQLGEALSRLDEVGEPVAAAAVLGERASLEATRGRPAAAESLYREALARIDGRMVPDVAWPLWAGLAHARRAQGAVADAAHAMRTGLAEVERSSRSLVLPERRAGFLADKWDAYAQLALMERERGLPAAAFEVSERLRAREMLELMARGRIAAPAGAAPELVVLEQDLRRRISGLTDELGGARGPIRGVEIDGATGSAREDLLQAQDAYAALLLEMRERAPRHASLVSPSIAGWRDVARRLGPDEVMIEYLVSDSGSLAFVVRADTLAVVDLGIARRDLAPLVVFAREMLEAPRARSDSLWRGSFRRLHGHLIAPVERTGLLARASRLVLVPHAELHYLPFAALLGDDGPLVGRYEIVTTPSATVWLALGDRPSRPPGTGVLAMAPRPEALPGSRREVEAVARLAGADVQTMLGARASEPGFLAAAPRKHILHLATYGVLNKHNPLFSFVEMGASGRHDGRLEVHEVLGLELAADLIVLSACRTALGSGRVSDVPAGDDWVGLTRAFLHAGARSVVATLWAVDDQSTAALMEEFYTALAASPSDPGRALARAQRAMLRGGATAHPFHWAGVVVVEGER